MSESFELKKANNMIAFLNVKIKTLEEDLSQKIPMDKVESILTNYTSGPLDGEIARYILQELQELLNSKEK